MCIFEFSGGRGWIWGGCSDNVAFGEKISKQFVDALEGGQDSRAAVNLHNNEAGRLVRYDFNFYFTAVTQVWYQIQTFISVAFTHVFKSKKNKVVHV